MGMMKCPDECKTDLPIYSGLCYPGTQYCMEYNWCPLIGQAASKSTEELLEGVEDFELNFAATMNFEERETSTIATRYHTTTVSDLLKEAKLTYQQVQNDGVVVHVRL